MPLPTLLPRLPHRRLGPALLALLIAACSRPDTEADRAQLRRQAAAWDAAIVRQDRAAIEANLAPDFRQIDARGSVEDARHFVDGLMDPQLRIEPYTVEDFDLRLLGPDVALLSGRTAMQGRYAGAPFHTRYRYIDVYVRREGQWRVVSVQISPLAAPEASAPETPASAAGGVASAP